MGSGLEVNHTVKVRSVHGSAVVPFSAMPIQVSFLDDTIFTCREHVS